MPSTIVITIHTDNDAFRIGDREVIHVLTKVINRIRNSGVEDFPLIDTNGNTCGKLEVRDDASL
jgi:hypothetical protein